MENNVRISSEKLTAIEESIYYALVEINNDYGKLPKSEKRNTWITKQIKQKVGALGYQNGYVVASDLEGGSWLYDLAWYKSNPEGYLEKVGLVLESELSDRKWEKLKFDFDKLLVANVEYRIMISFAYANYDFPNNVNNLLSKYEKSVQTYTLLPVNSRILVLIWEDYMEGKIHPYVIIKQ